MEMTREQARDSLSEIREVSQRLRRSLAASDAGGHLILWGIVWIGAFLVCGFWPDRSALAWTIGDAIGIIGSVTIGIRSGRSKVQSPDAARQGWRLFGLWLAMFAFVGLWMWLLQPTSNAQIAAFICTAVMFLYVVMGLWLEAWFLLWLGLIVTALTVSGYHLFPDQFYFWMAATGGGSLLAAGLYIDRAWK